MVKRVFGKVDGIEVNYDHSKGDWWNEIGRAHV